jgi:hypothetical protein
VQVVAPVAAWKVPAAQAVQAETPDEAAYHPPAQLVQARAFAAEYLPVVHIADV